MKPVWDTASRSLLDLLADGQVWSGSQLGKPLGISRAAVWKRIGSLRKLGLAIPSIKGKGYQLSQPLELLDGAMIESGLLSATRQLISSISAQPISESTNSDIARLPEEQRHGVVVLAEYQESGRGRRGRCWVSPFGSNLYLSLGWRFEQGAALLGSLSLATGVSILRALQDCDIGNAALKWPNDIRIEGRKAGGCLIEIQGDASGPCGAVVGIGLNLDMPRDAAIDQDWCDLKTFNPKLSRNQLAIAVINALVPAMQQFSEQGFAPFAREWAMADELIGQPVRLTLGDEEINGLSRGISGNGGLLVEIDGVTSEYQAGEVSLRGHGEEQRD